MQSEVLTEEFVKFLQATPFTMSHGVSPQPMADDERDCLPHSVASHLQRLLAAWANLCVEAADFLQTLQRCLLFRLCFSGLMPHQPATPI